MNLKVLNSIKCSCKDTNRSVDGKERVAQILEKLEP